jgi:hypothetical protein
MLQAGKMITPSPVLRGAEGHEESFIAPQNTQANLSWEK